MKPTLRGLALQMQAQGRLILEQRQAIADLHREAALRSALEIANNRSRIQSEEAMSALLPEPTRDSDYGWSVREPTLTERLDEHTKIIQKNIAVATEEIIQAIGKRRR